MLPRLTHDLSGFTPPEQRAARLERAVESSPHLEGAELGASAEGRPIAGVKAGRGPRRVTLISGSHADEPVGSETLLALIETIAARPSTCVQLLEQFSLLICPHVNPDGEHRNLDWIRSWPNLAAYLQGVDRELPGRDIEFGYPDLREENRAVAAAMRSMAPFSLHMSLHGMGFSSGAMLLIDRYWGFRATHLRDGFRLAASEAGLSMHDHNRMGEKGFFQIEPGYTTTPEGAAMRAYFRSRNEGETASLFRDSSMEYAQRLGGDPLCVVTELPLFVVSGPSRPGTPDAYLAFSRSKPDLVARLNAGERPEVVLADAPVRQLPVDVAVALQWRAISLSLEQVLE